MKKSVTILFTVSALLLQGCGSLFNLASKEPANYGGVQKDFQWLGSTSEKPVLGSSLHSENPWAAAVLLALIPTEVALSFTIDTLALPYTVRQNRKNHLDEDRPAVPTEQVETVVHVPSAD